MLFKIEVFTYFLVWKEHQVMRQEMRVVFWGYPVLFQSVCNTCPHSPRTATPTRRHWC